jgi:hypothetical protein
MCDIEKCDEKERVDDSVLLNEDENYSESDSTKKLIVIVLAFGNFCVAAGVSLQGPFFPKEAGN